MRRVLMSLTALCSLAALGQAQALEVRFYPADKVRAYELDADRGVRSVVLQNVMPVIDRFSMVQSFPVPEVVVVPVDSTFIVKLPELTDVTFPIITPAVPLVEVARTWWPTWRLIEEVVMLKLFEPVPKFTFDVLVPLGGVLGMPVKGVSLSMSLSMTLPAWSTCPA